ncbi:hypothetical protein BRPE64_BCDS08000 [Caballeronia insecticola]|uniref:Uncharacterized protein n=1 Tax=Caballeronia insecticola TaxID=758793 RepID=R4X0E6_9BURK|nr:hypothetical protein BRPE64_BCDS08000 [Caballeronia insecticola]
MCLRRSNRYLKGRLALSARVALARSAPAPCKLPGPLLASAMLLSAVRVIDYIGGDRV